MKAIFAAAALAALGATAEEGGHPAPPPEAIQACAGMSDGASCRIQFRDKSLDGICRAMPGGEIACVPPHGLHRGPPPEAIEACVAKESGAACSFELPDRTLSGNCRAPEGKSLACMPQRPPDSGK